MENFRIESDGIGEIKVASDKLWGAQTQRCLMYFNIGKELIPQEMIYAYALLKKAAAISNYLHQLIDESVCKLIVTVCDEISDGQHLDMFPLHVWMTGSGTQFNMNINEVISNRASQLVGTPLGSKKPVHPNDHVNFSQSSNDTFPTAMHMAVTILIHNKLLPSLTDLRNSIDTKAKEWVDIIKIGRTHLQDATPLTLGQEWSGFATMLSDNIVRIEDALKGIYPLALGGTAVGTGINSSVSFSEFAISEIAKYTDLPFTSAKNKFAVQGAHDALIQLSGTLKTLASSLYKIANDIRFLACGPRAGISELILPDNEPGSSIMPGKVNPTQIEALTMIAVQVMANDVAVGFGGAGGYLEMNVYKPLMIHNLVQSITLLSDGMNNFNHFMIKDTKPHLKNIERFVERSLMLVTALAPHIGYDKATEIAHYAMNEDISLKEASLKLGYVTEQEFDTLVDVKKMV